MPTVVDKKISEFPATLTLPDASKIPLVQVGNNYYIEYSVFANLMYADYSKRDLLSNETISMTIQDTDKKRYIIANAAAGYGQQQITLPNPANNLSRRIRIEHGINQNLIVVKGSNNIRYNGNTLDYYYLYSPDSSIDLISDGTYWRKEKVNNWLSTGWINSAEYRNKHKGQSAFLYDTKSVGKSLVGLVGTEATSLNTFTVLSDSGGAGTSGTIIPYDVTGTGIFTDNRVITFNDGTTIAVNEGVGATNKNDDNNIYHGLNLNLTKSRMDIRLFLSTDATENNAIEIGAVIHDYQDLGSNPFQVDVNNLKIQTSTNGTLYCAENGARIVVDTDDIYYKIKIYF
jgi:hypothetical protein